MRKMIKRREYNKSKGFTLIEVLVATSILIMAGVAAVLVEKNFIGSASLNKHKLQAVGLAQEGINAVKRQYTNNLLDNNLSSNDKMKIINGNVAKPDSTKTYYLDINNKIQECDDAACSNGVIVQNNISFTRKITFPGNP